MDGSIASAVMLPEQQEPEYPRSASPTAGQKRRQSSVSVADPKRQRLNSIDANANLDRRTSINGLASAHAVPERRERGRERRLFGAALGALSQNPATAAQRKRSEIEKRQRARRELEEQESDQRKMERDIKRRAQRQREQERFERESMHIRHANLLNTAHFLRTEAVPRLYYKPWETTADEDDIIRDQVADAEETVRHETEDYETQHKEASERERHVSRHLEAGANLLGKEPDAAPQQQHSPSANGATNNSGPSPANPDSEVDHADADMIEAVSEQNVPSVAPEQNNAPTTHESSADAGASKDAAVDETGEEVVEAAEDTVIY